MRAQNAPVLVFTRFRETLAHIVDALEDAGLEAVSFQGGQSAAAKQEALARFRSGARVMVATDVGAQGQNMQFCHVLVNYDLPWNPMLLEQRIGQLHRMGQTEEVVAYNLCAKGTVEERVLDVLDRRLRLFELVVGEMDMVLGNLADERDLEERILHIYATTQSDVAVDRLRLPAGAQSLDRLRGDGCGGTTSRPALCDDRLHSLCEACVPSAQGRPRCAACANAS